MGSFVQNKYFEVTQMVHKQPWSEGGGYCSQVEANRYYTLEYKVGQKCVTIKQAAQSLCFVISKEQCEGSEPAINDSIACLSEDDMPIKNAKNKVKVKFQQNVDQIINSLSWEKKTINKH